MATVPKKSVSLDTRLISSPCYVVRQLHKKAKCRNEFNFLLKHNSYLYLIEYNIIRNIAI